MSQMNFTSLLILSLTIFGFLGSVEPRSRARAYIETQCKTTLYFDLCVKTLLPFANKNELPSPHKLAQITLTTCLAKTRFTMAYVDIVAKQLNKTKNPGEYQALEDCLYQIKNGVNQITLSVKELQQMGKDGEENFSWHESNVQSWVSAALSDATTCIDGILVDEVESKEKNMIKAKFLNVKQLASNSIALFTRFTARHRASRAIKNP
ncbi:hypothetical protein SSX86_012370 [Deinandra increscens subsp. villosa]|uniref:Pectinesterase inhibitor domain-containing protein n=1 Tax=Deinandra increscens subsp. villosa TaxID=3103831 RepID=A0AAP0DBN9_9ASTR